jgi:hypothetical protein
LIETRSFKRHCERSEAIQFFLRDFLDCFGAKRLAMTVIWFRMNGSSDAVMGQDLAGMLGRLSSSSPRPEDSILF